MALVVLVRVLALATFPVYDDAFITFRYAANLAAGHGLVYHPGAAWEPVLGTTTPLFALVLAGLARLGLDPILAARGLNLVCGGLVAWLLALVLERRRVAAGLALLAFAVFPPLVRIDVGGMEPPLLALLTLAAIRLASKRHLAAAGALSALACTVRPEAGLLAAALLALHVRSGREALRFLLPAVAIGAAALGLLWITYGHPLPQSIRAKASNHGLGPELGRTVQVLQQGFAPIAAAFVALPLVLLGYARGLLRERGVRALLVFALATCAAYIASGAKTWGWYFYVPLLAWCVALALGAELCLAFSPRLTTLAERRSAIPALVTALALLAWPLTRSHPDRVTAAVYEPMAAWARQAAVGRAGARIAATDIGAIGYWSGATILDSEGLVWPEAERYADQLALIRAARPEYVLMVAERERVERFRADPVGRQYRAIARFDAHGTGELEPDPATLSPSWIQDYLLYERVGRSAP